MKAPSSADYAVRYPAGPSAIVLNAPVLSFTSICSPIFGMVGCLIPAWLVYKVPALHKYKGVSLVIIVITGLLLCVSPFLAFS